MSQVKTSGFFQSRNTIMIIRFTQLNEHELNVYGVLKIIISFALNRARSCLARLCCEVVNQSKNDKNIDFVHGYLKILVKCDLKCQECVHHRNSNMTTASGSTKKSLSLILKRPTPLVPIIVTLVRYNWTNMSWNCTAYFLDARTLLLTEHLLVLCVYAAHPCSFNYKSEYSSIHLESWMVVCTDQHSKWSNPVRVEVAHAFIIIMSC